MAPREGYEDGNIAEKHIAETGATSWSTFTKRPISRCFSYHRKHTDDELQMDAPKFPTAKFLLMKHNFNQELIGSKLENEIVKPPCVRTSSRNFPPSL